MLTVVFLILTSAAIFFGIRAYRYRAYDNFGWFFGTIMCGILAVVAAGFCIGMWCSVATEYTIDQKIVMYQEENAEIEVEIDTIVKEYMAHEKETFESIAPESGNSMALVSLFPELKSDELVKQQINLHTKNAEEIKNLKAQKIDLAVKKWLLYFGR